MSDDALFGTHIREAVKALGTTCDHCWHHSGTETLFHENVRRHHSVCCHCGATDSKDEKLYGSASWPPQDSRKHGPHKPDIRSYL